MYLKEGEPYSSNNNNYNTISDTKLKLAIKEAKKANLYKTKRL